MSRFTVCVALLALTLPCLGQDPIQSTETQVKLLSDVLPPSLADFIKRSGADRAVDEVAADRLESLASGDADAATIVEVFRPTAYTRLSGPVTFIEQAAPAKPGGDAEPQARTLLLAVADVCLSEDAEVAYGEELHLGDVVKAGAVLNAGQTAVLVETAFEELIVLPAGGVIVGRCLTECSVGCVQGYYACCTERQGCAMCKCAPNGTSEQCDAGGPNAESCSASVVRIQASETDE
ncbi:MAG TPA: hypothetical protein VM243_12655 [Phycisphaerae bacterium]|nr:hypothetical protein [Phycisphaerae bacterium]